MYLVNGVHLPLFLVSHVVLGREVFTNVDNVILQGTLNVPEIYMTLLKSSDE
jgi:hypothetical protein